MAINLDLKQYINTYGLHNIKVIATGEGFRNSETVEKEYNNNPFIIYTDEGILFTNVQPGVSSIDFYVDEVLEKTIEHDAESTEDVLIDFSNTSVIEGSINHFIIVAHTDYGDFTSNNAMTTRVFGVSGMYDSSVALTRTDDSVGKTYNIDSTTGLVTSDFDDEFPYNTITEVTVGDSLFISIPEMWWRVGTDEEDNITDIAVARYKKGAGNWYKSDAFLVGKYLSYQENNMMVSKSGKATSQNYSALQWTTYAKANGEGYKPYGYYEHTILAFLWLIEFANKRSTNIINGYSSYNQTTGGTDSIETSTGYLTANNRMKYRGIEDFIGNDAVWMPDVTGAYYTSRDVETYKNGATNKTQLSYYMNITVSSSWRGIQSLGWDDNNPFICLPSKLGSASSTTYFGTNMYGPNGSNEYLSRNKIYSGYSSNCNLLSPVFDYQFSNASSTTTSRLIKYEI